MAEGLRLRGASGVLPASAKPVSLQNTEMIPGARSSSTELQLLSADLLPLDTALQLLQLAQWLCPQEENNRTGRSNFKRCFYHLFVNLLINILCQKSLVQQKCNFCMNVLVSVNHSLRRISSDTISGVS